MKRSTLRIVKSLTALGILTLGLLAATRHSNPTIAAESALTPAAERGQYLVVAMGCGDCHTPLKMGPQGPEPDRERYLSGHPAALDMPPGPVLGDGPWMAAVSGTMTAWSGPWGMSFVANLTPDPETGLGRWTEEEFVATARTGRHRGRGRELLPPMPRESLASLTDEDLSAIFAYLRSIPAVSNPVPLPRPATAG